MLLWSIIFLFIAIITGFLAFSGVVVAVTFIAKLLFAVSIVSLCVFFILFHISKIEASKKD